MAFFNLTYVGSQNPFKASAGRPTNSVAESSALEDAKADFCQDEKQEELTEPPSPQSVPMASTQREKKPKLSLSPQLPKHSEQLYRMDKSTSPFNGSHEKLTTLRTKHYRHVQGLSSYELLGIFMWLCYHSMRKLAQIK